DRRNDHFSQGRGPAERADSDSNRQTEWLGLGVSPRRRDAEKQAPAMSDLISSPPGRFAWSLGTNRQTAKSAVGGDVAQLGKPEAALPWTGRATGSSVKQPIGDTETWMIWQWSGLRHL